MLDHEFLNFVQKNLNEYILSDYINGYTNKTMN